MQTILERYKALPEAGLVSQQVEDAHEAENRVFRAVREYFDTRLLMENKLRKDWTKDEVQAAGLAEPTNPRETLALLVNLAEVHLSPDMKNGREMLRLIYELDCTMAPLLRALPEPPSPQD